MKSKTAISCIIAFVIFLCTNYAFAQSGIDFYRSFIVGFPSVQSYSLKGQALESENRNLLTKRFLNPTATVLYSNYQTENEGTFSISAFSIANTIDIFNKTGIDRDKNRLEIKRNIMLTKTEKKNVFSKILAAYADVVRHKYLLRMHQTNLDFINQCINFVSKGVIAGIYPETELTRWNIERINQLNLIEIDKLEIKKAEETLRLHSGVVKIITENIDAGKLKTINTSQISEIDFIKNSPEIETLNISQKELELDIKKENRDLFPNLQVSDTYELNSDPTANGNQNIALAALNFTLPNGSRRARITSARSKIQGIELDKQAQITFLQSDFRCRIMEINTQKTILINYENATKLSKDNLNKLFRGYQKRFINFTTVLSAVKEQQTIYENYVNTLIDLDQNYEYLYHLSKGDIY